MYIIYIIIYIYIYIYNYIYYIHIIYYYYNYIIITGVHPWAEFFNVRSVSRPANVGDATSRLLSNLRIFYMNYLFVFMGLTVYCV